MALMHFGCSVRVPNLVSFNAALEACRLGSCWSLALQLLGQLEASSLEADVVPRTSLGCGSKPRSVGAQWWPPARVRASGPRPCSRSMPYQCPGRPWHPWSLLALWVGVVGIRSRAAQPVHHGRC